MPLLIDLTGRRFERWLVIGLDRTTSNGAFWKCKCDCGVEGSVLGSTLRRGTSTSCRGCSHRTHGMTRSPEFNSWQSTLARCTNPHHKFWEYYGGRGITVCKSFLFFSRPQFAWKTCIISLLVLFAAAPYPNTPNLLPKPFGNIVEASGARSSKTIAVHGTLDLRSDLQLNGPHFHFRNCFHAWTSCWMACGPGRRSSSQALWVSR
jgi:hypothetical protein